MARTPAPGARRIFTDIPAVVDPGPNVFSGVAAMLKTVGDIAMPLALQEMQVAGANAVTTDANGKTVAKTRIPFTKQDEVYNAAAASTYFNTMDAQVSDTVAGLAQEYSGDPVGYQAAVKKYRNQVVKEAPALFKGDLSTLVEKRSGTELNGLVRQHYNDTRDRAKASSDARITSIEETILRLEQNPTPENIAQADGLRNELTERYGSKQYLPGVIWTQEQSDLALQRLDQNRADTRNKSLSTRTKSAVDILSKGQIPTDIHDTLDLVAGTPYAAEVAPMIAALEVSSTFGQLTPAEQDKIITDMEAKGATGTDQAEAINGLKKIRDTLAEDRAKDPIKAAKDAGEIIPALDLANPDSFAQRAAVATQLKNRGRNADGALFSETDKTDLSAAIKSEDPAQTIAALTGIANMGSATGKAVAELGIPPDLQQAIGMTIHGADPMIAADIVAGAKIKDGIKPDKAYRGTAITEILGSAIDPSDFESEADLKKAMASTINAADQIFKARTVGISDPESDEAEAIWTESLQAAMGGSGTRGGVQQVNGSATVLPPAIDVRQVDTAMLNLQRAASPIRAIQPGETRDPTVWGQNTTRYSDQERGANVKQFWQGTSTSGGVPQINGADVKPEDMAGLRVYSLRNFDGDIYSYTLQKQQGGEWLPLRDSATGEMFRFDIRKFAQKGR